MRGKIIRPRALRTWTSTNFITVTDALQWDFRVIYRAYKIDHEGHFAGLREIEALDDAAAVEQAKKFADGQDIDVWHRGRRIARIARQAPQPKSA
jgi:hypothetical protein